MDGAVSVAKEDMVKSAECVPSYFVSVDLVFSSQCLDSNMEQGQRSDQWVVFARCKSSSIACCQVPPCHTMYSSSSIALLLGPSLPYYVQQQQFSPIARPLLAILCTVVAVQPCCQVPPCHTMYSSSSIALLLGPYLPYYVQQQQYSPVARSLLAILCTVVAVEPCCQAPTCHTMYSSSSIALLLGPSLPYYICTVVAVQPVAMSLLAILCTVVAVQPCCQVPPCHTMYSSSSIACCQAPPCHTVYSSSSIACCQAPPCHTMYSSSSIACCQAPPCHTMYSNSSVACCQAPPCHTMYSSSSIACCQAPPCHTMYSSSSIACCQAPPCHTMYSSSSLALLLGPSLPYYVQQQQYSLLLGPSLLYYVQQQQYSPVARSLLAILCTVVAVQPCCQAPPCHTMYSSSSIACCQVPPCHTMYSSSSLALLLGPSLPYYVQQEQYSPVARSLTILCTIVPVEVCFQVPPFYPYYVQQQQQSHVTRFLLTILQWSHPCVCGEGGGGGRRWSYQVYTQQPSTPPLPPLPHPTPAPTFSFQTLCSNPTSPTLSCSSGLSVLPRCYHTIVGSLQHYLQWLLCDELVAVGRCLDTVSAPLLQAVAAHVQNSHNSTPNCRVRHVPLKFVFGEIHSLTYFTHQLEALALPRYYFLNNADYYYLEPKPLLSGSTQQGHLSANLFHSEYDVRLVNVSQLAKSSEANMHGSKTPPPLPSLLPSEQIHRRSQSSGYPVGRILHPNCSSLLTSPSVSDMELIEVGSGYEAGQSDDNNSCCRSDEGVLRTTFSDMCVGMEGRAWVLVRVLSGTVAIYLQVRSSQVLGDMVLQELHDVYDQVYKGVELICHRTNQWFLLKDMLERHVCSPYLLLESASEAWVEGVVQLQGRGETFRSQEFMCELVHSCHITPHLRIKEMKGILTVLSLYKHTEQCTHMCICLLKQQKVQTGTSYFGLNHFL